MHLKAAAVLGLLLGPASLQARQIPRPKAHKARVDGAARPTATAVKAPTVAQIVAQAKKLRLEGKFAPALALLNAWQKGVRGPGQGQVLVRLEIANIHFAWAKQAEQRKRYAEAIVHYEKALEIDRELRPYDAGFELDNIGNAYVALGRHDHALKYFNQALSVRRKVKDRRGQAVSLANIALTHANAGQLDKALSHYEQAIAIHRADKRRREVATLLNNIGVDCLNASRLDESIKYFEQALPILREVKDQATETTALSNLGLALRLAGRAEDAMRVLQQALPLARARGDRASEASALESIGAALDSLSRFEEALGYFEQSLRLYRAEKDAYGQADSLNSIGMALDALSRREEALKYFAQALPILRRIGSKQGEAAVLTNIGTACLSLSRYEDALKSFQQALPIQRAVRDRHTEAITLNNIGMALSFLSRHDEALKYFVQALPIVREVKYAQVEATVLNNMGGAHETLGRYPEAITFYEQALPIQRAIKDRFGEAATANNIGISLYRLGRSEEALARFEQALQMRRAIKDRGGEGSSLSSIGGAHLALGRRSEALKYFAQALPILREAGEIDGEAKVLNNLMHAWRLEGRPRLAIFYGKQSVNAFQSIRGNIRGLDKDLQRGFLKTKENTYRYLADLLISQDRLPEAQQVLGLLKEEEFFQFVRRDAAQANGLDGRATLSPGEAQAQQQLDEAAARVTRSGARRGQLLALATRTPEQEAELEAAETDLEKANRAFEAFLANLEKQFAQTSQVGRVEQIQDAQALQETLRDLGHGAVALYTLVGEDKVRVMLVTPDARAAGEHEIKREDLNRKIAALRRVLQSPTRDPRPLAQEMHKILLGPLQKALDAAGAKTLMWSLDGPLRYIPVAALHDGDKYLVERYSNTIFTPASTSNLKDEPGDKWRALGLGVTREKPGFSALPSVEAELRGIIENEGAPAAAGARGILPGTIALDDGFTEAAMKGALRKRPALVHIASHFQFQPGDETTSFLLLGDGKHLSLDQIKNISFGGVKLLTLSACDTASGGTSADGTEVEGFAVLAQRQGAQAVLASLWPVADSSTQQLMHAFYREREKLAGTPKSHALRQAQLSLLGEKAPAAARPNPAPIEERGARGLQPKFEADPEAPFAHPYFWAPFVLIGNWK